MRRATEVFHHERAAGNGYPDGNALLAAPWFEADRHSEPARFSVTSFGAQCAPRARVRDFTELVCWQLANELKCHVFDFTSEGPASRDFKFRDRIRDSSASAAANIAEGFGYYQPGEFARFLGYARASLIETRNHLLDAYQRNYIGETLYQHLSNLTRAATRMTTNLMLSKQRAAEVQRRRGRERTAEARRRRRRPAR